MSYVNIVGLGGLQENGKNLYCVEVDSRIFILDAGNKYPTSELYGIDSICPDISYLVKNKDKIEGVFLTHAHDTHMGSVFQILKEIKCKVYATHFTMIILEESLRKNKVSYEANQLVTITNKSRYNFSTAKVSFFTTSHNVPDCVGINIDTKEGLIIYTGNFTFDQNLDVDYLNMFKALTYFGEKGVLALLAESKGSMGDQNRTTSQQMRLTLEKIFNNSEGRMVFSIFSSNLGRVQQVVSMALKYNKRIAIVGRNSQAIVDKAISFGYLNIPEDKLVKLFYIDAKNKKNLNNESDLVCIVIGEREQPYNKLIQMAEATDRLIHLEEEDTVVILTKPYLGTEKLAASALDSVYKVTTNVEIVKSNLLPGSSASREEIKQMINILKPKYIVPVIGEYSQFYTMKEIAECINIPKERVVILDNGDVAGFTDGKFDGIVGSAPVGEVLIDGPEFEDVNGFVMRDRELLAEDGLVMIIANINSKSRKVVNGPQVVNRGIHLDEDIILAIEKVFFKATKKVEGKKYINWSEYKNDIKDDVSRLLYKKLKQSPIIIPVIIATAK